MHRVADISEFDIGTVNPVLPSHLDINSRKLQSPLSCVIFSLRKGRIVNINFASA